MAEITSGYYEELTSYVGTGWNEFWFRPRPASQLLLLSRLVHGAALIWLVALSVELPGLFGAAAWISPESVHQVTTNGDVTQSTPGFSHLFWIRSTPLLWITHGISMLVVALATLAIAPRWSMPLSYLIVLSYVHRAPMVTGQFELVLCMLLLYLAVGAVARDYRASGADWVCNVITRLLQVHLCGFYLMTVTAKLGTPIWWSGDATWYLVMDAQHRLLNLRWLVNHNLLINGITHLWLLAEVLFPVLIWQPRLRPLMIAISSVMWVWTGVVTGLVGYAGLMLCANVVFLTPRESSE